METTAELEEDSGDSSRGYKGHKVHLRGLRMRLESTQVDEST
jgi:hypothetical protein